MQILRGILLTVGTAMVFLAACATEWEPVPILLMGGTGLALCGVAKGIKKAASTCWNTSRRQNLRKNIYFNFTRKGGFVKPLKGDGP